MLDNSLCVAYQKNKPFIIGNGTSNVKKLILQKYGNYNFDLQKNELKYIPKTNEKVIVGWKNNLACNSTPQIVTDESLKKNLVSFAKKVVNILNLRFCSVDIFSTNNGLKLLEVNSIVSMEIFSKSSEENYKKTKQIFEKALEKCFE